MKVFKYEIPVACGKDEGADLMLPRGAEVLRVGAQDGALFLWALVEPDAPATPRRIRVAMTGEKVSQARPSLRYLGTADILFGGGPVAMQVIVAHCFEVLPYEGAPCP